MEIVGLSERTKGGRQCSHFFFRDKSLGIWYSIPARTRKASDWQHGNPGVLQFGTGKFQVLAVAAPVDYGKRGIRDGIFRV